MGKAIVYGSEHKSGLETISGEFTQFNHVTTVTLEKSRSESKKIEIDLEESDIIQLTFDDQSQWIGSAEDVTEIYGITQSNRSGEQGDVLFFDSRISGANVSRGGIGTVVVKALTLFRPSSIETVDKKLDALSYDLVSKFDHKFMTRPGLFEVLEDFQLILKEKIQPAKDPYLLLIHGTMSNTVAAFGDLHTGENAAWQQLASHYGSGILALEHFTLSQSPLQNALDFLMACSPGITIDIMSHSRGGLVADVLAKCDKRNNTIGFSEFEMGLMAKEDEESLRLMKEINLLSRKLKITVRKVIRVAAPASGTSILGRRIDHFFNVVLNALGLATGGFASIPINLVKTFLLEVIAKKGDPQAMPGLASMVPDSVFQKMLNNSGETIANELYVISGDAEAGGKLGDSVKVILANLFYWKANDLVVDTHRMDHGAPRAKGFYKYLSQDAKTNHFNYFINQNTCDALLQAVTTNVGENPAMFTYIHKESAGTRGVVLDIFSMEGVHYDEVTGNKPILILLPGIMGSSLDYKGKNQWIDLKEISRGAVREHLDVSVEGVSASGVIKKFYDKFIRYMQATHDVVTFPFDWRNSVVPAAAELAKKIQSYIDNYNQPIHIVAHSMGGLVVRQVMYEHQQLWENFINRSNNKFVMLGTPWLGSYLVMEVLTGHSSRVKQLAMLDFKNNKKELMEVFTKYMGIYHLLPLENGDKRKFWTKTFWGEMKKISGDHMVIPEKEVLDEYHIFQKSLLRFVQTLKPKDFKNVYYVAGLADQTVYSYTEKKKFLSKDKKLVYLATTHGDGSVTWTTGIPSDLPEENLYFTRTSHGDLANDEDNFEGLKELILEGKTSKLLVDKPALRSAEVISEIHGIAEPLHDSDEVANVIFGVKPRLESDEQLTTPISVSVVNGDLKISKNPVMLGHFFNDGVYSAERALDRYLDGRLSQRHEMGYYPGKIGESEVFFNLNTNPKGAIICGLGTAQELTHFLLAKTIEMATLKYSMFIRDNYTLAKVKKYAGGISFILIGTGYGGLKVEDSVKGIMLGVSKANEYINEKGLGLREITQVEIVNYYESLASQAYWALSRLIDSDKRFNFELVKGVKKKEGAKKMQTYEGDNNEWWHHFFVQTMYEKNNGNEYISGFKYNSSAGLARVEEEQVNIRMDQLEVLLEIMSQSSSWDMRLSKTLFELLIPNRFKDVIRNQNNIIFKVDIEAAQFPWEMFYDSQVDEIPAAVSSGMIRQLRTTNYEESQIGSIKDTALVIGDPIYGEDTLPQLPAAEAEARLAAQKLMQFGYDTKRLIGAQSAEIMMQMFSDQYKILHFSGHGLYEPENGKVGIAIGNGICINPAMIKQMSYVPEFVFINCCYSGKVVASDDAHIRSRYKLAANVGTQLIQMGVKAIIVTGWAVDDAAAGTFAEVFYSKMVEGYEFGDAVQLARKKCFQEHGHTNTWGAYQCYGYTHYRLNNRLKKEEEKIEYVLPSQVYVDIDNLYNSIKHSNYNSKHALVQLEAILDNAQRNGLMDGKIREKEALIYDELNMTDKALETFRSVLTLEDANFSVKVLEHFCLLRSMNLSKVQGMREAEIDMIVKLALVGKTTLRLGIVGNAYKFAALDARGEERIQLLETSLSYYKEAYILKKDPYDGAYLDALSNIIFIGYLLELEGKLDLKDLFKEFTQLKPKEFLEEQVKKLDDIDPDDTDISALLGMAEAGFGLLLVTDEDPDKLLKHIIADFHKVFQLMHSLRQIRIEKRQLEFLIGQEKIPANKRDALERVLEALELYH
ncbi:MAG: hypothetical protein CL868_04250 [Cytophagaceae bacterium]|nr:hypothetical protein [Cytophagaceae bacterium]|tara:strand:+ start:4261 stop:9555 length:5295 start_codon:yes stop_codon:yes gene_type:complete